MKTVLVFSIVSLASIVQAQTQLQNDGFKDNQAVGFQAGFVAGEQGASRFVPLTAGPHRVEKISLLFGGNTATQTVTLNVYDDSGLAIVPGALLYSGQFMLQGANDILNEIELTQFAITVPGPFRVGIEFHHAGAPSIARDGDGNIMTDRNWIQFADDTWHESSTLGLAGDWIIRATVMATESGGDAGPGPGPDAGTETCALNSDCPNGQYCGSEEECTFDCRIASDCASDQECDSTGQCITGDGEVAGNGDSGCGCRSAGTGAPLAAVLIFLIAFAARHRFKIHRK